MGEKREMLEYHAESAFIRLKTGNVLPAKRNAPGRWRFKTCDDSQGRCLATTARPDQGNEFSLTDRDIQFLQHLRVGEALGHTAERQITVGRHCGHSPPCASAH